MRTPPFSGTEGLELKLDWAAGLCWLAALLMPWGNLMASDGSMMESGSFFHHPGIRIEMIASEPDVVDPVALTFDAEGMMYVVEMRDYPYGKGPTGSPGGTIRSLRFDAAGDLQESHLFAEQLSYPTSITAYQKGVLVAAKDLIYLADTDGDHRADIRQTIITGFHQSVTDSNFSGLRWGLDNRLHGVNGGNDGKLRIPWTNTASLSLEDADFAWDPKGETLKRTFHTGGGFGLIFDRWGRSFTPHNINHMLQRILPVSAMERFMGYPMGDGTVSISDHGEMARIFPVSEAMTRVNHPEQAGHFSSSGGMGLIPKAFETDVIGGGVLVCDVVGNLVHRDVMSGQGPGLVASRATEEQHAEFIASRDTHFRPVGLEQGPDGALYLIDMQREVIEHPDYIPDQIMDRYQIRGGEDRGRIYRIHPTSRPHLETIHPGSSDLAGQVALLGHEHGWVRATAQRLIVEKAAPEAPELLTQALHAETALHRLHAMWSMEGLGRLERSQLKSMMQDPHPELRAQALRVMAHHPEWWNASWQQILRSGQDDHPSVRFQSALLIGAHPHPDNIQILTDLWMKDWQNPWMRKAVLTALREYPASLLSEVLREGPPSGDLLEPWNEALQELAYMIGARLGSTTLNDFETLLNHLGQEALNLSPSTFIAVIDGTGKGAAQASIREEQREALRPGFLALLTQKHLGVRRSIWQTCRVLGYTSLPGFEEVFQSSLKIAGDIDAPTETRLSALDMLSLGSFEQAGKALIDRLNGLETFPIQARALEALRGYKEPSVAREIIQRWREIGPGLRPNAIGLLLGRRAFHLPLIEAIETDQLSLGELNLDLEQRRLLMRYSSAEVKARASRLLGDEEYSNRKTHLDQRVASMPSHGRAQAGLEVFKQHCASCHRSGAMGYEVGPDLSDMSHRSVEDLAYNILDPNMAINPSYIAYEAETLDGELITGIPSAQSSSSVTLLMAQGVQRELPRKQLAEFRSGGLSLMPEGFEEQLSAAELRNLIAFLQTPR